MLTFRPDVCRSETGPRPHGAPVAHEGRPTAKLRAEAGEFHAGEEHGQDHVADAVGGRRHRRAAVAEQRLEPVHEADRLGAADLRELHDGGGIEGADAVGEHGGAHLVDVRELGMPAGALEQLALGRREPPGDHDPGQRIAREDPAEGQLLDRIGVVKVEPGFRLAVERGLARAQRMAGDVSALVEHAVGQHQRGHGHVRIEPHIVWLLLAQPEMDVDEDRLVGDAALGEREPRDHRIVGGGRMIEARLGAGGVGGLGHGRSWLGQVIGLCGTRRRRANRSRDDEQRLRC